MAKKGKYAGKSKINLKSNNAGYATRDSKGNVTYYKSSKDSSGYSDEGTMNRSDMSAGNPLYTKDKNGTVLSPSSLSQFNLPDSPTKNTTPWSIPGLSITTDMQNAGFNLTDNQYQYKAMPDIKNDSLDQSGDRQFNNFLASLQATAGIEQPNMEREYGKMEKDAGIAKFQKEVGGYTSQLNNIMANAEANQLKLEGQGRGVPDVIIGGQQAQIAREAAIAAIPVQAALDAAQGNLDMAQTRLDKLFSLRSKDLENAYTYKKDLVKTWYSFMDKQEQNRANQLMALDERSYKEKQSNLATIQEWTSMALEAGRSGEISRLAALDPESKTFQQDLARATTGIAPYVGALERQLKQQQLVTEGLQQSKLRKDIEADTYVPPTINGKPQTEGQTKANTFADRLLESEGILVNSNKFGSFFARGSVLPNFLKSEDRQEFEQAQRNFINSVLRRESGAVISDQEFTNARRQYFPQPGDTDGVLAQKRSNRNTVINGFYREANIPRPVGAGDIIESGGKRYKVDADGETLIEI